MGSYLNPGNFSFRGSLCSKIYIDKSGLISKTNETICTEQKYICVSRPRKFGKSMAANMLAAYYDRSESTEELFNFCLTSSTSSTKYVTIYSEHLFLIYECTTGGIMVKGVKFRAYPNKEQ